MPFGASHVVEVVTDADWGSQAFAERDPFLRIASS